MVILVGQVADCQSLIAERCVDLSVNIDYYM